MRTWDHDPPGRPRPAAPRAAAAGTGASVWVVLALAAGLLAVAAAGAGGQEARIRDLTVSGGDVPVRLMGYGLVVGLDGTGDRVIGGFSAGHTVRSVANLLRRFNIEVPEHLLRTRNVAAVLVTAETSPYLRPGGRFDVHVASVGDATSLRGGVLWTTPLQASPTEAPVATAQGPLIVAEATPTSGGYTVETSALLPEGGVLEASLPAPDFAAATTLYLREPDLATAARIAEAVNAALGDGAATVADPGAVTLTLPDDPQRTRPQQLADIGALTVVPERSAEVVIDSRAGTVIAGGDITIGEAVVSHGAMTLAIGAGAAASPVPGDLRVAAGATVQEVAAALHGVAAPPQAIAAVFESLRAVGALTAKVTVR